MMKINIYAENDLKTPEAVKIIDRLKAANIIPKNCTVELLFGGTQLWGLMPCLICTEKEVILFNNLKAKIVIGNTRFPYQSITGCAVDSEIMSRVYLYLGGADRVLLDFPFNQEWAENLTDFILSKIKK